MANYQNIIPFIKQAEGGLSKATSDAASSNPVPDGSGYHTNEGITWTTMQAAAGLLGITSTALLIQAFYQMTDATWDKIFKWMYWDKIMGDQINSQAAADTLVDWAWGAGPGQAIKKLQQFLTGSSGWLVDNGAPDPQLSIDGGMGPATLQALNAATQINEAQFVSDFSDYKKQWYLSLPNQSANYAGWEARLDALYATVQGSIGTGGIVAGGILLAGLFFLVAYNIFKKK